MLEQRPKDTAQSHLWRQLKLNCTKPG